MKPVSDLDTLIAATRARRIVLLRYGGVGPARRAVHPHVVFTSRTDDVVVDVYQVEGPAEEGLTVPGWRPLRASGIDMVDVLDETFELAPGFDLASPEYKEIIAHCMELTQARSRIEKERNQTGR